MIELFRTTQNPWGQDVLLGVSWNLMWAAVVVSVLFLVGHSIWYRMRGEEEPKAPAEAPAGIPEHIQRHSVAARAFHWTMSVAMLTLLITAFVPVIGYDIPSWVTVHWMAGVLLIASVVYHIIHSIGWQDFWAMTPRPRDITEGFVQIRHLLSKNAPAPPRAGKYPFDHRLYHHAIVVVGFAAMITGVLMMMRIDTPFFARDPYRMSDAAVGVTFVIHGLAGVSLILLIASHIYFALRPEKRWITWSMFRGWIDREHYLAHHDPQKWVVSGESRESSVPPAGGALADSAVSAPAEDG